jgi:hypothetical protein
MSGTTFRAALVDTASVAKARLRTERIFSPLPPE